MRAAIWADCGPGIGLGHVSRCAAVGAALSRMGVDVATWTADGQGAILAEEEHAGTVVVGDLDTFLRGAGSASTILVDSYRLSESDWQALNSLPALLGVFDDLVLADLPVDILINGAAQAERLRYRTLARTTCLLGLRFFALRERFQRARQKDTAHEVERVVVTLGGSSGERLPKVAAVVAAAYPHADLQAVLGAYDKEGGVWPDAARVTRMPQDFAETARTADLVVCGGGQTLYEAVALGVPTVGLSLGADHHHHLNAMVEMGGCLAVECEEARLAEHLEQALDHMRPHSRRQDFSDRARQLIDGEGSGRIAGALVAAVEARGTCIR